MDITKWLVDNFTPFVEYYKDMDTKNTPKQNRIGSRIERIRNMLTDLVSLTQYRKYLKRQRHHHLKMIKPLRLLLPVSNTLILDIY